MSPSPITIRFTPTEADLYQASRDTATRNPWLRLMMGTLTIAPVVLIGLSMREGYSLSIALFRNVFWLIVVPLFWLFYPFIPRSQTRKAFRKAAESGPIELVMEFDEAGFRYGNGEARREFAWSQVRQALETRHAMVLFSGPRTATYFPLEAMEGQLPALRELIRRRLGDRARLRPGVTPRAAP